MVGHAGSRLLSDLADQLGLTEGLSVAMAPTKQRRRGHDRGQVLTDLAVMIAGGGTGISDLAVLRDQPNLFGEVASTPTAWRTLEAVDTAALERIAVARAVTRRRVWAAGADPKFYVIDFDATLITAHSDKTGAAPNYKKRFGFHPLLAFLDATGEALAGLLRPGNAGSNTAADHITVLDAAFAQLPVDPTHVEVIARADSAGLTHGFIDACVAANVNFTVGHDLTEPVRNACLAIPARAWKPAITADGSDYRDEAWIAEITNSIDLSRWPTGSRMIVRREIPHPDAQLSFTDIDGHRYQAFITDQTDLDIAYLEALQRGRGRAEKLIFNLKDTGCTNLPSADFEINQAWLTTTLIALDLLVWCQHVCLEGDLARAEPKRLRYTLLYTAGVVACTGRRTRLRLALGQPARHSIRPLPPTQTRHLTNRREDPGAHAHQAGPTQPRTSHYLDAPQPTRTERAGSTQPANPPTPPQRRRY